MMWLLLCVGLLSAGAALAQGNEVDSAACADGTVEQQFGHGVVGCGGAVPYVQQRSLCGKMYRPVSAAEWVAARQGAVPTHDYWVREPLLYDGTGTKDCSASATSGDACPRGQPMRVCTPDGTDPFGNTCVWTHCGLDRGAPDDYFGGCATATAGTLCAPAGCADGTVEQVFSHGMVGCGGTVFWPDRQMLCAPGFRPARAEEWVAYRGTRKPSLHYWTDDDLKNSGDGDACSVSPTTGKACPAGTPMRVCMDDPKDMLGNSCNWHNCGYEMVSPGDYFGGCTGDRSAGTLCIPSACADGSDEQVFGDGSLVGCAGQVAWDLRGSLCASGYRNATSADWVAQRGSAEPNNNYWIDDVLGYGGYGDSKCSAQSTGGNACPTNQPMRVCTDNGNDLLGNHCNWVHCGLGALTPDAWLGGCQGNTTAGALCLRDRPAGSGCADGTTEQAFARDLVGCGATAAYPERAGVCAAGWTPATASAWIHARGDAAPTYDYWTDEPLFYAGRGTHACSASNVGGGSCPKDSPMRVCTPDGNDPFGNTCHWTHCGFGSKQPDQYFGGCTHDLKAGVLCLGP